MPEASSARQAFIEACTLDVAARKPGNVSLASPGHGMSAGQFLASARAAAPWLCEPGAGVGWRVEQAMRASWAAAGCNTNLGIVLLCAPLAAAAQAGAGLQPALAAVLAALSVDDARAAFRAIAATQPAGLGTAAEQDVHAEPTVTLRQAMQLAQARDLVARQYANGFAEVFDVALPAFNAGLQAAQAWADGPAAARHAMQCAFVELLARFPDSHIARKHGDSAAHTVNAEAQPWAERARQGLPLEAEPGFAAWDEALKRRGLNPGTTADLCVATAMAAALLQPGRLGALA